ncbi:cell wall-binding repeat-containing protein [Actinokineospora soli]|uniref:Cell wall-binding repeat-containing protein n=1 Tax=Actinokineospora soli TaxID=1048753 RepID=A0ABW2TZF4_9PSEU
MAGGPLAAHLGAPLLLTSPTALLADVRDEIKRVLGDDGGTVYLLGGTGSLSAGVESSITSLGYTAKRLAGADRYQTAIKIAEAMPVTSKFFVTTGTNFPDALAAGSAAAHLNRGGQTWALLFTNDTRMPASTAAFANARKAQVGDWTLVTAGGAADQAAKGAFGAVSESFVGANRFATAVLIADRYYTNAGSLVGEGVGLANGTNFPDALAGTATLAVYGEPLLLTNATTLPTATRDFLVRTAGKVPGLDGDPSTANLDVLGGTGVVSEAVESAAEAAFTP